MDSTLSLKRAVVRSWTVPAVLVAVILGGTAPLGALDFLRGDTNNDGNVTISDVYFLNNHFFLGGVTLTCREAGDTQNDGGLDIADSVYLFNYLTIGGPAPDAPFPAVGPDPDGNDVPCESYGSGSELDDPTARMTVLDTTVAGGVDRLARITIATSSAHGLAALGGTVGLANVAAVGRNQGGFTYLPNPQAGILTGSMLTETGFEFGFSTLAHPVSWTSEEDLPVLEILVCLEAGVAAGEYPIELLAGEFSDSDSGRAILPELVGGTLTVLAETTGGDCDANPPRPIPPDATFTLSDATSTPGFEFTVPFTIEAALPSQGFSFSVDFDESILEAMGIEKLFERDGGVPYDFEQFSFDNADRFPGNAGVQEGFFVGAAIISLADTDSVLPLDEPVEVLNFHMRVKSAVTATETEIRFEDGALNSEGRQVDNGLFVSGELKSPTTGNSFVFISSRIEILPKGIPFHFLRGDSNDDGALDISDPLRTLNYLFGGGANPPPCLDAADANDDGGLDVGDPVFALNFMFRGTTPPPPPFPLIGLDPTDDDPLGCDR